MSKYLSDKAAGLAQMAAHGASTGMLFGDAASAKSALEAVEGIDAVVFAVAFQPDGNIFTSYQGDKANADLSQIKEGFKAGKMALLSHEEVLLAVAPVLSGKDKIGFVAVGISESGIQADLASNRWTFLIISIFILVLGASFSLTISKFVTKPITALAAAANKLATGDINVSVEAATNDEIGKLALSFKAMVENIKTQAGVAQKIADGNLDVRIVEKSTDDVLSHSMQKVVTTLQTLLAETKSLTIAALDGNLSKRGNANQFEGGYKEIVSGINATLDTVIKPMQEGSEVLQLMAKGDLTVHMSGNYKGDFAMIKESINNLADSLCNVLGEVTGAVQATASASTQISSSAEELAAGAQEQSAQTSEVASAVTQMTRTIIDTTSNIAKASETAKVSGQIAGEGGAVVSATIIGMNRVADVVTEAAATVKALGSSSDKIGEIVQVIDDIADQTNLLALNAAIEAARAGEQGRGFAVVADEVRKLAERTTKATKEIAMMIKQIQKDTGNAVVAMEKGTEEVNNGKNLAQKAELALQQIINSSSQVVDNISSVAAASEEQSSAIEEISKSIDAITAVTHESASGTQEIARAAEDLSRLTDNLQNIVTQFKISDYKADRSPGSNANKRLR
ncbi:MAG: HAMP domain-containing protein [Ignavibacteriales bacterium]|nr:HAMP domain-containing protein [Ignavibacteriales bacterium]